MNNAMNHKGSTHKRYVSIDRDFKGRPAVTYWSDVESGDDAVTIFPAHTKAAWKIAYRIGRVLRRCGYCRIESNGITDCINPDAFDVFSNMQLEIA